MSTYTSVNLPLYPDYYYSYVIALEGNSYTLDFKYNEWGKKWYFSLFDQDSNPVVQSVALVPEYPILSTFITPNLTGIFWLSPIPSVNTEKYVEFPANLDQYYTFEYIYNYQS